MKRTLSGAVAGAVGAVLAIGALAGGSALAGTGVGGVFNLGQTNAVNATTTLTGTPSGPSLSIKNNSTAPGSSTLSLSPAAGRPAITVDNKVLNPQLNAQYLGGYTASGLSRIGMDETETLFGSSATDTRATVTIQTPAAKGFVVVDGSVVIYDGFTSPCTPCFAYVYLHDVSTGADSPVAFESLDSTSSGARTIHTRWVFPVTTAGNHSYTLTTAQNAVSGGPAAFYNPQVTVQYVPFGATGSGTSLGTSSARRVKEGKRTESNGIVTRTR